MRNVEERQENKNMKGRNSMKMQEKRFIGENRWEMLRGVGKENKGKNEGTNRDTRQETRMENTAEFNDCSATIRNEGRTTTQEDAVTVIGKQRPTLRDTKEFYECNKKIKRNIEVAGIDKELNEKIQERNKNQKEGKRDTGKDSDKKVKKISKCDDTMNEVVTKERYEWDTNRDEYLVKVELSKDKTTSKKSNNLIKLHRMLVNEGIQF